jgi:diguanylate cyclase (GGDEF)-like protein
VKNKKNSDASVISKRFRQILIFFIIAVSIDGITALVFSSKNVGAPALYGINIEFLLKVAGATCGGFIFYILNQGKVQQAATAFLCLIALVGSLTAWPSGGMQAAEMMSFPLVLIFAAIITSFRVFLGIFLYFVVTIILFELNRTYVWIAPVPNESGMASTSLGILSVSAYSAWLLGKEMKAAFFSQKQEHQRVLESQKVIQELADTDQLTGLLNRTAAKARYESMLSSLDPKQELIVFYFIDLDNFKSINDLFDHHAGDQLLMSIAERLKGLVSQDGVVARIGGDEFIIFVKASTTFDSDALASGIMTSLAQPHFFLGTESEVTASVGITLNADKQLSFDSVRKKSDMAMINAKQLGKNNYHYYSDALHMEYMRNINILNGLKEALSGNLLDVYFQPKVNLLTNKVDGAEALLRWNRGNPENIRPDEFIPVIESTELIHEIGAWVIQQSCRSCKNWHKKGHKLTVAVNVSALQLTRDSFYDTVVAALKATGLPARYLEIELTEHFLIQENSSVRLRLNALKTLGVKLAIDDFGTGYSNMGYLTRLNVDVLKLDQSFISQIGQSKDSLVVITAIIEMAKVLHMKVVAEGVETNSHREALRRLGCDIGQGFLWSKALPCFALVNFLDDFELEPDDGVSQAAV